MVVGMSDPVGHLVEYIEKNRIILGLVQSGKKNKLAILTAGDKQVALPQSRALLLTPAAISPERPRDAQVEYLRGLDQRREELAEQVDVAELWELVHEESQPLPLQDLAELVFGAPVQDDQLSATLRALFYERLHFKLSGGEFLPLSPEQLEKKIQQQEREAAHRAEVDRAVEYLQLVQRLPVGQDPPPAPEGLLELLRDLVVFEEEARQVKKAKEIVSLAEVGGRRKLFELLVRLGVFAPHENLPLLREQISVEFPPEVMAAAEAVAPLVKQDQGREDLTDLYTFTIDGTFTTDFDDALSFEPLPDGGGLLGVHITDVAAVIQPGDPLDLEAMERGSTIYMPDTRVPMLPPLLSEDALSLRESELRPALSCLATLDAEGRVKEFRLCRSVLKVDRRLTYEEADQMLESDRRLAGLHRVCEQLRRRRGEAGAYFLPLPEVLVGVDEAGQVHIRRVDREGPSREMVAETAILANQLMARYLAENQIPALFRTQAPPHEPIEEGDPHDLYLHFKQRRLLNRVEITTKPGLHSSLGIQPYTHLTSPIRRYLDLVMQRQLGAVLSGKEPLYGEEELKELAMQVEPNVRRGMRVRQARQRYWILTWLRERRGQRLPAIVMEYQVRRWQLLLTDCMVLTTIPSRPGLSLEPGQEVEARIERADPFEDILRVSLD